MKAMPKDPPAHLAAPKRTPSPHNKQPAQRRTESPTARFMPQAVDEVVAPAPATAPPRKAPPPIPPDSDEDSQPAPATTTTPRKAPPHISTPLHQCNNEHRRHLRHRQSPDQPRHRPHHWYKMTVILGMTSHSRGRTPSWSWLPSQWPSPGPAHHSECAASSLSLGRGRE